MKKAKFLPTETAIMRKLLRLALSGKNPWPNPYTAAAVIRDGTVIATGRHEAAGTPHAEVMALRNAGTDAKGATLMVTLEPCTHWGRTPPCVEAIANAGIRDVIYAVSDPNPAVRATNATQWLTQKGIQVRSGLCEKEALRCNAPFMKYIATKQAFVTAKIASSLDGKIALSNGESTYITGPQSRNYVHHLRANHDVIVVGIGTVLADNPLLTVRHTPVSHQPAIVILDTHARTPLQSRLFEGRTKENVIIITHPDADTRQLSAKATIVQAPKTTWPFILETCQTQGWHRILIEGGEQVFSTALDAGIVDRLVWCIAPILLGGEKSFLGYGGKGAASIASASRLMSPRIKRYGQDMIVEGFLKNPHTWIQEHQS